VRRRAVDQRHELEVEVGCAPSRIAAAGFVAAYDRVAPLARRDLDRAQYHHDSDTPEAQAPVRRCPRMSALQVAIYARGSSEPQADAHTIASQLAALRARVATDGSPRLPEQACIDDGYSGAPVVRPGLERLRDVVAAGGLDRLSGHAPDWLARQYASQGLLVDELQRAGVEVVCLNRELGQTPADELLLQGQGLVTE
jgi:hypothetical protein